MRVNVVGAGRVGRSFMTLLSDLPGHEVGDVLSSGFASAQAAVADAGAGRAVRALDEMTPADLWLLTVPDDRIAEVAISLAASSRFSGTGQCPMAVHCSGFLSSNILAPLRDAGWSVGSCHPVRSFADPALAAQQFAGTFCGIEGDRPAVTAMSQLVSAVGGVPFDVGTESKALYHAAAVFSSNFTVVLQAMAQEAWRSAGVEAGIAEALSRSLLHSTTQNLNDLSPRDALTGPAARGDTAVLSQQAEVLEAWRAEAAEVYRGLSALAMRLKQDGTTG
ncbi:Predicted oxidoreductase, contains short-chain dehydrogenase (SDR) and DUF2520 domains [Poseidonocella pacifica]|uniref:Predicted oxidoreductase, contains short-chain dehydrogenase (SDR) and DUF2520 domains n=1 Tax=Poseidonocella pacifica TaxID=871651 RepID=A0A1I0YHW4_9RHOB|nr:Rossmann-like and DUF2520 domain-containing protein [Poseidonocella pacifica]SFB12959.1 Predicted oxidoreductase, contains short-chain dehydrogenase (SDR) and DUF2520 domains [Poseidonocella pacifica]